jgi:hypothetical protein
MDSQSIHKDRFLILSSNTYFWFMWIEYENINIFRLLQLALGKWKSTG